MSRITRFFITCSGAALSILGREECQTEHSKYVGIGATVFFTAVLAAVSGGYALQKAFGSIIWAITFGLIWGLMIFNLDRFIVSSIKKVKKDPDRKTRQRLAHWWNDLLIASPRIILAVFFSLIITKPLELGLFEREIGTQIDKENTAMQRGSVEDVGKNFPQLQQLEQENAALRKEIEDKEARKEQMRKTMNEEREGRGFTRKFGDGSEYNRYKSQFEEISQEYLRTKERNEGKIDANEGLLQQYRSLRDDRLQQAQKSVEDRKGLAARISALSNLAGEEIAQHSNYSYYFVDRFLLLLFILIEISPIVVKLFARYGPYDEILEQTESYAMTAASETSEARLKILNRLNEELLQDAISAAKPELANTKAEMARDEIAKWRANWKAANVANAGRTATGRRR